MTQTPRVLMIDGHSMAFRAFYALPAENFSTSTGQYTNAVYGFTSMLINLLRNEDPEYVGVAFDVSRHTFRNELYADYKGTRAKTPEEFKGQIGLIKQVLDAMGIAHAELDGFEGDDIVATWSFQADQLGWENLIVTGDRDSFQLVDDNTTVLYPKKGVSELAHMTPDAVEAKYGVTPEHYPELAALVGDTSDNLIGVPGVGPKTAAKWLKKYGDLATLLDHVDEIKGKVGDSLREHIDDVKRNRELNHELTDVATPLGVEDLARGEINREAVHEIFDALQFRTLRDRLFAAFPEAGEPEAEEAFEVTADHPGAGELAAWFAAHRSEHAIGVDVTGSWAAGVGDIDTLAFATVEGQAAWVDVAELTPDDESAMATWLEDPDVPKAMHGAKGPLLAMWSRDLDLAGLVSDTQLAAYLLHPDQRSYELDDLSVRHLGRSIRGDDQDDGAQGALDFSSGEQRGAQAGVRALAVTQLSDVLDVELDKTCQLPLLHELEMPLQRVLARMERRGVAIKTDVLDELRQEYDDRVTQAQQAAWSTIDSEINLGSPKQLQAVLFDQLGMPKTKRTKSGYTTDADALEKLYAKTGHPFLEHLLVFRDTIKLRQIIDTLIKSTAGDGRIHTTYAQTVAGTGRLSSTDPNLQNIPIRTAEGRRIRDAFVPGEGFDGLMSADYSQIEMRVMAAASGDQTLIDAFASGADFHSMTASHVYGVPVDEVTGAQRSGVKQMNYGLAYGLSAYGLSSRLNVSVPEARELMDQYFETFGQVRDYLEHLVDKARKQGYTETMRGRRRYLPDLNSSNRQRREMAERMALNAPMQGTAADIIKTAMLQVEAELAHKGLESRMLLQIHDELVLEVAPGERERVEQIVGDKMRHAVELTVPLDVSFGYGDSWNSAAH